LLARNWYRRLTSTFPVVILYHHLVSDRPHRMGISTHAFERQVRYLKQHYRIASLAEGVEMLKCGRVDRPTVVLTFDDGYRDNLICLRAVTEEEDISAALFLCTDHLRSGKEFAHDVRRNERGFFPLDWPQAALLQRSGMTLGSHTRSHFDCGSEDADALRAEIAGSQQDFAAALGAPTPFFSFPWGNPHNMSRPAVELARMEYPYVFSGCGGANLPKSGGSHRHLKRRLHMNHPWELELALQGVLNLEFLGRNAELDDVFA
jgi:peptidoglycan/xylan/chitin deacetylase (PgdA/CDA1 family)